MFDSTPAHTLPRYDIVVATRNRAEALSLSLPLMLAQSCPPTRLVIVDSSDDPHPVAKAVEQATAGWLGEVILRTSAPGLPRQRNLGLRDVTAPVVFFFDDDSLLHPGAAEAILDVYAHDTAGRITGVAAAETPTPPRETALAAAWRMTNSHVREARFRGLRNALERRVTALKPALYLGSALNARHAVPAWLGDIDAVPVEYMTGFRMTFRTEAIRSAGFDENLTGYALDEDIDASFTAMASGLVVAARGAHIYHHRHPGGRGVPRTLGYMSVFNRAHVLLKHAGGRAGSPRLMRAVWRRHRLFMALKVLSLVPKLRRAEARKELSGVLEGVRGSFVLRRQLSYAAAAETLAKRLQKLHIPTA